MSDFGRIDKVIVKDNVNGAWELTGRSSLGHFLWWTKNHRSYQRIAVFGRTKSDADRLKHNQSSAKRR